MKKLPLLFLLLFVCIGFVVRLYRFNNPIADWHSWRQADTSAVSRNFVDFGFDLLHPRYYDISNVQSGLDNPQGYRFVEFPIYNAAQAGLFVMFKHLTLEEWGRLITILSTLISAVFLYLLGRKYAHSTVGLLAASFYLFLPYTIFYGRTILPDPSMTMTYLGAIYFFSKFVEGKKLHIVFYFLSVLFAAISLLLKPFAVFFLLPLLWIAWEKWSKKLFLQLPLWIYLFLSIIPLVLWRIWMSRFPEGIPAAAWLFNGGNIRFTGAYFYWIFSQRIAQLILGYWGLPVVIFGILASRRKYFGFFLSFLIASVLYLAIVARGNVQHDYYQIPIIPSLALFFGLGVDGILVFAHDHGNRWVAVAVITICSIFSFAFGWYQVRDYFNINNYAIVTAGKAVDELTPKSAKIIAPYNGDTSLLYQTHRKGWPSFEKSLPELVQMGAGYLVLVNWKPQDKDFGKTYKLMSESPDYLLFDLHKKP